MHSYKFTPFEACLVPGHAFVSFLEKSSPATFLHRKIRYADNAHAVSELQVPDAKKKEEKLETDDDCGS